MMGSKMWGCLLTNVALLVIACVANAAVTTGNNFTMLSPEGQVVGGANDMIFTWDGTQYHDQTITTPNAKLESNCPFFGFPWSATVFIYGPGTYTFDACPDDGSSNCTSPALTTLTVMDGQIGAHILFNWSSASNIDIIQVWDPKGHFDGQLAQSCGSAAQYKKWDLASTDADHDAVSGVPMVDGPFKGFNANFNLMTVPTQNNVTISNNFTMYTETGEIVGGANSVQFDWDGTLLDDSDVVNGQEVVPGNATLESSCLFFAFPLIAEQVWIYGPGTYTFDTCPSGDIPSGLDGTQTDGSSICTPGDPSNLITMTVAEGQIGGHALLNWSAAQKIDLINVWDMHHLAYGPMANDCTIPDAEKIWDLASKDIDGDGIPGGHFSDGPFKGFSGNFNLMVPGMANGKKTKCRGFGYGHGGFDGFKHFWGAR